MGVPSDLARILFPSRANGEEEHVYKWRLATALLIWSTALSLWLFVALAFGTIHMLGFQGFATRAEAAETQQLVKDIRVSQLENQLQGYRMQQCVAQMEGNAIALSLATMNLREKGNVYWQLTGRIYMPEDCSALLVVRR